MNLFRSEEHVKNWPLYDSISAESIMPLSNWATSFSGPLFRNRLQPDYLSRVKEYAPVMPRDAWEARQDGFLLDPGIVHPLRVSWILIPVLGLMCLMGHS